MMGITQRTGKDAVFTSKNGTVQSAIMTRSMDMLPGSVSLIILSGTFTPPSTISLWAFQPARRRRRD